MKFYSQVSQVKSQDLAIPLNINQQESLRRVFFLCEQAVYQFSQRILSARRAQENQNITKDVLADIFTHTL